MLFYRQTKRELESGKNSGARPWFLETSDRNGANSTISGFSSHARFLSRVHFSKLALLAKKVSCFSTKYARQFPENSLEYSVERNFNLKTSEQRAVGCSYQWFVLRNGRKQGRVRNHETREDIERFCFETTVISASFKRGKQTLDIRSAYSNWGGSLGDHDYKFERRHTFAYLTITNSSFAHFARVFFIFVHFTDMKWPVLQLFNRKFSISSSHL